MNLLLAIITGSLAFVLFRKYWIRARRSASLSSSIMHNSEKETDPATGVTTEDNEQILPQQEPGEIDYSEVNRAYRIGDMHFSRGNFDEAEKWFIKTLAIHSRHTEAMNKLGVIYIQQGNSRRAEILYRKLFSISQKEPTFYCNYGRCLYNQGRHFDAIEAYENAIKLDSTKASRFVSIGQIYYEQKDFLRALSYFGKALDLEPNNMEFLGITVDLAEVTGDAERLQKSLKKLSELDPYNEEIREKIARFGAGITRGEPMSKAKIPLTTPSIQTDLPFLEQ